MATLRTCNKRAKRKRDGIAGRLRRIAKRFCVQGFKLEISNSLDVPTRFRFDLTRNPQVAALSDEEVATLICRSLGIVRTVASGEIYSHTITSR